MLLIFAADPDSGFDFDVDPVSQNDAQWPNTGNFRRVGNISKPNGKLNK